MCWKVHGHFSDLILIYPCAHMIPLYFDIFMGNSFSIFKNKVVTALSHMGGAEQMADHKTEVVLR